MDKEEKDEYIASLLAEQVQSDVDKKALIEEFTKNIPKDWSPDDVKDRIRTLMPKAYSTLTELMDDNNIPSSTRLAAAKYVFDIGIGQIAVGDKNDPDKEIKELLKGLMNKDEADAESSDKSN